MTAKNDAAERKQILIEMTSGFCDRYLDPEYRKLCEKLINKMARKSKVPFLSGKIEIWAAAVVHALGYINFLFDKGFTPYATMDDICGYFNTVKSSTSQKSKLIRDMFKMWYYDPEFSTASVAQSNPLADMVIVDGLIIPKSMFEPLAENVSAGKAERHLRLVVNKGADTGKQEKEAAYIIKATLKNCKPPIWRRFQVPGGITLYKLHRVLQVVMGWENYHLYQFVINKNYYSDPGSEYDIENARKTRLDQLVSRAKTSFIYEYDFGDGWLHNIQIEKILPAQEKVKPVCLAGERACPPEDCGGPWGYESLLEVINDPDHEEYEEMLAWAGEDYDPEAFDLDQVNKDLKKIKC